MFDNLRLAQDIQCGMVLPAQNRQDMLRLAPRMEAAGFDSIWVGDHVSFYIPLLESLTALTFVSAITERVRLGTSVYLLPLRHPTPVAKITSTLDLLSGGRLTLGVGVGGEFPPEYEACGIPLEERGARIDEAIEVLRKLWTEDRAEHRGKHFSFGPLSVGAKAPLSVALASTVTVTYRICVQRSSTLKTCAKLTSRRRASGAGPWTSNHRHLFSPSPTRATRRRWTARPPCWK